MVYTQPNICPGKWDSQTPLGFWDTNIIRLISARRPDLIIIKKRENLQKCGLCCPSEPQSKIERMWKEG